MSLLLKLAKEAREKSTVSVSQETIAKHKHRNCIRSRFFWIGVIMSTQAFLGMMLVVARGFL